MEFQDKVRNCEKLVGTHINIPNPYSGELFGELGFDYIWIDLEHTAISIDMFHHCMMSVKASGTPVIVRVPEHDLTTTKKVLEMGPDGVIFPMIHNAEEAKEVLSWTLYPPYGKRGCGPQGADRYGLDPLTDWVKDGHLNKLLRFVMIEQKSAVCDIDRILEIPYLDGIVIGLWDLSGSIGKLGNPFCEQNLKYAQMAMDACKKHHKSCVISMGNNDYETLKRMHDMGVNMITAGCDFDFQLKGGLETLNNAKKAIK